MTIVLMPSGATTAAASGDTPSIVTVMVCKPFARPVVEKPVEHCTTVAVNPSANASCSTCPCAFDIWMLYVPDWELLDVRRATPVPRAASGPVVDILSWRTANR